MNSLWNPWLIAGFAAGIALVSLVVAVYCLVFMTVRDREIKLWSLSCGRAVADCSNAAYLAHVVPTTLLVDRKLATWDEVRALTQHCDREAAEFASDYDGQTPGLRLWKNKVG